MYVVPDPSERWTTVMSEFGRETPGLTLVIAGSFHFFTLPRKMSASRGPVNFNSTFGRLYAGTTAPRTVGKCRIGPGADFSCSSVIGPSLAPKNTVWEINCLIPPPEPIG